jgi:SAM-dependent methyltransferase
VTVDFRVASGEALPWSDGHFEVVAFSNSLHHMPDPAKALAEAKRVLKRGGLLYVMEPVPSGNYHDATCLVNDETEVRTEAYRALLALLDMGFDHKAETMYLAERSFGNFEEWKADQIDRDEKRRAKFEAQPDAVRKRFESAARHHGVQLTFDQVFRVDVLEKR